MLHLAVYLLVFIISIPVGFLGGVVLSDFWGWFVTPIFTTLPEITSLQGWGVMMLVGLLNTGNTVNAGIIMSKQDSTLNEYLTPFVTVFCVTAFYLLSWVTGWFAYTAFIG